VIPRRLPSTQGLPLREKRAGGFRILEVRHDAGVRLAAHSHLHPSLCCVLEGGFEEWMDGASFRAEPASLLVEPAELPHRSRFGTQPTRSLILEVECPRLALRLSEARAPLNTPAMLRGSHVARLGRLLTEELYHDDPASLLAAEGLALELVAAATRARSGHAVRRPPAWLLRVEEWLRAHFRETFDLAALARAADVHPVHLARSFRGHFGESLGEHVRRLRLAWCAERLAQSEDPVARIALQSGFCDQSHLARHFRRAFGCTPGRYRQARRGG